MCHPVTAARAQLQHSAPARSDAAKTLQGKGEQTEQEFRVCSLIAAPRLQHLGKKSKLREESIL